MGNKRKLMGAFLAGILATGNAAWGQTDVAASFYRTFIGSTSGNGTTQSATESDGGSIEVRHMFRPLAGVGLSYALNPDNQTLSPQSGQCGIFCSNPTTKVSAKASEVAIVWVGTFKAGNLRPFVDAGLGAFIVAPSPAANPALETDTIARPAYVAGAGVDWGISPRVGLRLQYRDSFYLAPDLIPNYPQTGRYTQTGEPMVGVYFRL